MRHSTYPLTAKTRQELAEEYNISRRTLYNWLKKAGICNKGKLLTPREVKKIYEEFGYPERLGKTERF